MAYPNGYSLLLDFTQGSIPGGMTFARTSTATDGLYTDAAGSSYNSFASGVARLSASGILLESLQRTNFLLNSDAPATQTTSAISSGSPAVLWVIGTGSATVTQGTGVATGLGTATAGNPVIFTVTTTGTFVVTVSGSLTRFQLERGGQPTSYIPTAGAIATRQAESLTLATGAWFNAAAGTLMTRSATRTIVSSASAAAAIAELDDGTLNNYLRLQSYTNALLPQLTEASAGTQRVNQGIGAVTVTLGTYYSIAARYSASSVRGAANNTLAADNGAVALPVGVNRLACAPNTQHIRTIIYWPFALSDADLQTASADTPLAQIAARGSSVGMGTARPNGRVRPSSVGLGASWGRANPYAFSIARIAASGFGLSGSIARASIVVAPPPRTIVAPPDVTVSGYDTLLLDRDLWDLCVDAYGDIAAAQAPYALSQDVASAIRLFLGELWYDTTKGIPYFEEVLGHWPPLPLLKSLIEQAALTVPRVAVARAFVTEAKDRTVTGQVQITTTTGQQFVITETFLGKAPG